MKNYYRWFFYFIVIGILVWGFITPSGIRGAWANNLWSLDLARHFFNGAISYKNKQLAPPTHTHSSLLLAEEALKHEEYNIAIQYLTPLLKEPNDLALDIYARTLYGSARFSEAFKIWERRENIAELELAIREVKKINRPDLIVLATQSLYNIDPEKYTSSLAKQYQSQNDFNSAKELLNLSIYKFPYSSENINWLRILGDIYYTEGNWTKAENSYLQTLEKDIEDWQAWVSLGMSYYRKDKNLELLISCINKAIAIDPQNNNQYYKIGSLLKKEDNYSDAKILYKNAINNDPDNLTYHMAYADLFMESKEFDEAIKYFGEIINRFPDHGVPYFRISWAYWLSKQPDQAILAIEKAIQLESDNSRYYLFAGTYYEQSGLSEKALVAYKKVIELDPNNQEALQGVNRLSNSK